MIAAAVANRSCRMIRIWREVSLGKRIISALDSAKREWPGRRQPS